MLPTTAHRNGPFFPVMKSGRTTEVETRLPGAEHDSHYNKDKTPTKQHETKMTESLIIFL